MRYALLIYTPEAEAAPDPAEMAEVMTAYNAFTKEVVDKGAYLGGEALQDSPTATTVRVREGRVLTSDGPFAETKEVLGGFYLLECESLDEAAGWAAKIPGAAIGSVEVRPIWEIPSENRVVD